MTRDTFLGRMDDDTPRGFIPTRPTQTPASNSTARKRIEAAALDAATQRVEEFLTQRRTLRGLDPDHITAANHAALFISDLARIVATIREAQS